jgi:hypothetical protein
MIALTWRQHRLQALSALAVLAALAAYLLVSEHQITSYMGGIGLSHCLASHGNCNAATELFTNRYNGKFGLLDWLVILPLLVGLFWGAPLLAREAEHGTHRLAWTQSVGRARWLTVKLAAFIPAAVVAAAILTALLGWAFHPLLQVCSAGYCNQTTMTPNIFSSWGIAPAVYTLYALALGTAAGAFLQRTIPAMAVTTGGFLGLRLALLSLPEHQPASRFWTLQATEAGIFGGAAVILLGAAIWRTTRRDA